MRRRSAFNDGQSQHDVEAILRQFEWYLLALLGHLVSFTHEAYQDQPIREGRPLCASSCDRFVLSSSGFLGQEILAIAQGCGRTLLFKNSKAYHALFDF